MTRHYLDTETHLDNVEALLDSLHTSRYCIDTLMIAVENGIERKEIIYL